ncbi:YihY/virulence factor BrkB family protein [Pseudonocardia sp.]|uniref:YihY/virulence factor BrkB family protein n=1 Tax=Pseudonocardia sp. TaxID=60912 RepID=UPI0026189B49|nr:YihY/virulence factor BrkB family protein [Pseudonocardia sp.]
MNRAGPGAEPTTPRARLPRLRLPRLPGSLRPAVSLGRELAAASMQDRLPGLAAEVAFFAVLGVFPGLLIAAGLLGVLDVVVGAQLAETAQMQVVGALDTLLTDRAGPLLSSVRGLFESSRGELLSLAAAGALVSISGAFAVVVQALNLAYDVDEHRSWLRRRLLGLGLGVVTLVAGVLALAALVVGPLLGAGSQLAGLVGWDEVFGRVWDLLRLPVVALCLLLFSAALFRIAPNRPVRWRDTVPGALLTTALWGAASAGFHLYLTLAADANPVLGAFGGGAIVMIWVYLLSLGLLLGGELNAVLLNRRRAPSPGRRGDAA